MHDWSPIITYMPTNIRSCMGCLVYDVPMFPHATVETVSGRHMLRCAHLGNTSPSPTLWFLILTYLHNMNRAGVFHNDTATRSNILLGPDSFGLIDFEFVNVDACIRLPMGFSLLPQPYCDAFYSPPVAPDTHTGEPGVWVDASSTDACPDVAALTQPKQKLTVESVSHAPARRPGRRRLRWTRPAPIDTFGFDVEDGVTFTPTQPEVAWRPEIGQRVYAANSAKHIYLHNNTLTFVCPLRRITPAVLDSDCTEFAAAWSTRVERARARLLCTPFCLAV